MVLHSHNFYQIYCTSKKTGFLFFLSLIFFLLRDAVLRVTPLVLAISFQQTCQRNLQRKYWDLWLVWSTNVWGYPEYEDCPHHVEKLQDYQKAVEDVVGGEHVDVSLRGVDGGVEDTGGE